MTLGALLFLLLFDLARVGLRVAWCVERAPPRRGAYITQETRGRDKGSRSHAEPSDLT